MSQDIDSDLFAIYRSNLFEGHHQAYRYDPLNEDCSLTLVEYNIPTFIDALNRAKQMNSEYKLVCLLENSYDDQ